MSDDGRSPPHSESLLGGSQSDTSDVRTCWTLHLSACLLAKIVAMRKAYLWLALACLAVDYSLCTASSPELQFKSGGAQRPGTAVLCRGAPPIVSIGAQKAFTSLLGHS